MRTVVGCAALLASLFATALEAQDVSVQTLQLTYTPLASPEAIISRPTEKDPLGEKDPKAIRRLDFRGKRDVTLDLAGGSVALTANADGTVLARVGNRQQLLRPVSKGGTIQSMHLLLDEGRKCMLAFPTRSGTGPQSTLTCRSGVAQVATIDGESVWFYDHNIDGRYVVGEDAVRVGDPTKMAVFAPLSSYIATAGGIYQIVDLADDGSQLQFGKYNGSTGHLEVKFAGGSAEANLVIASADGQLSTVVTAGVKVRPPVTLFPGHYDVVAVIVTAPGLGEVISVVEGASLPSIDIAEGETTTLELGAPLALEFKANLKSSTQVAIDRGSVKLRGKSGEAYSALQWSAEPDVSLVSAGTVRRLGKLAASHGQAGGCYTAQIPELRGRARAKIVITGTVDGLGGVRGETQLE